MTPISDEITDKMMDEWDDNGFHNWPPTTQIEAGEYRSAVERALESSGYPELLEEAIQLIDYLRWYADDSGSSKSTNF